MWITYSLLLLSLIGSLSLAKANPIPDPAPTPEPYDLFHRPSTLLPAQSLLLADIAPERERRQRSDLAGSLSIVDVLPTWDQLAVETVATTGTGVATGLESLLMADVSTTATASTAVGNGATTITASTASTTTAAADTGSTGNPLNSNTVPVIGPSTYNPTYASGSATIPSTAIVTASATGSSSGSASSFGLEFGMGAFGIGGAILCAVLGATTLI